MVKLKIIQLDDKQVSLFSILTYQKDAIKLLLEDIMAKNTDEFEFEPKALKELITEYSENRYAMEEAITDVLKEHFSLEERAFLYTHTQIEVKPIDKVMMIISTNN